MGENAHKRINSLRCYERVHEMVCYGYPLSAIQKYIQEERGECTDITDEGLLTALVRYREDALPKDMLTYRMPHVLVRANKQYSDKLEELKRLDVQYEAMLWRIDLAHARERETGVIDGTVDRIQKSITEIVRTMHIIKMDLGISGAQNVGSVIVSPERLEEIRLKYGAGAAMAMADPVSRGRVIAALQTARELAKMQAEEEKQIIDVEVEPEDDAEENADDKAKRKSKSKVKN